MYRTAPLLALTALVSFAALPARADLGAAGTRVSVAEGAPRFCMTYGHMDEPELFAPIMQELKRLQVTFSIYGDTCVVHHQKRKVATWKVVRARDDIPALRTKPFLLDLGGSMYVPVKQLSKLLPIDLKWDPKNNLLSVVTSDNKPAAVATQETPSAPGPQPSGIRRRAEVTIAPDATLTTPDPAATGSIELSAVTFEREGDQLQIRVQASASVRPSVLYLKAPARIALDFADARWAPGIQLPEGIEPVRVTRVGHPSPGQARLVLELASAAVKIAGIEVAGGEVRASLRGGTLAARAPSRNQKAKLLEVLGRRREQPSKGGVTVALGSRGGNLFPTVPGSERLPQYSAQVLAEPNAWQYIIIHHSAGKSGNAAAFNAQHQRKGWDGLAYHFVINNGHGNPDGYVEVSPRWSTQKHGAHAGAPAKDTSPDFRNGFNEFGIGICLVGNFERSAPTDNQLQVLAQLIQSLRAQFNIPADHVLGHGMVKGTACPGSAFPWTKLYALMDLPAPQHLHKHSANLTTSRCPWCQEQSLKK